MISYILLLSSFGVIIKGGSLNVTSYRKYEHEEHWFNPGCIFNSNGGLTEHISHQLNKMKLLTHTVPESLQSDKVLCFIRQKQPIKFSKFKLSRLERKINENMFNVKFSNTHRFEKIFEGTAAVVFVPGNKWLSTNDAYVQEVVDSVDEEVAIIPPNTQAERDFVLHNLVEYIPSVYILTRKYRHKKFDIVKKLEGLEVDTPFILLHLLLVKHQPLILAPERLQSTLRHIHQPIISLLFSSSDQSSYLYAHAFTRTYAHIKWKFKFLLLDIADYDTRIVVSRHLKVFNIRTFPVVVIFTQDDGQLVLKELPTPYVVHRFISIETSTLIPNNNFQMCSGNSSTICFFGDKPLPQNKKENTNKKRLVKKKDTGLFVKDNTWSEVFSITKQFSFSKRYAQAKLVTMVFIKNDCSYCQKLITLVFEKVHLLAKNYLSRTSLHMFNCSEVPMRCSQYHVTGYPTMLLFQRLPSTENCFTTQLPLEEKAVDDYTGDFNVEDIMTWLSKKDQPAVKFKERTHLSVDVALHAEVYTRSYIEQHLPRSLHPRLVAFSCYELLCETMHNVDCYATPATDVHITHQPMFLKTVGFVRKDNASAGLFTTGQPMQKTIEQSEQGVNLLHKTHRYGISRQFKCEDDSVVCMDVVLQFVREHSRMPLTTITTSLLHSHQKEINYLWQRPILLALAHAENITEDATFYKELYGFSLDVYSRVNVAVLNADEHVHFAHQLLPKHFHSSHYDIVSTKLFYPRFALFDLHRNNRAAFFPPLPTVGDVTPAEVLHVTGSLDHVTLKDFVHRYMENRTREEVETERF